jgi:hypothetical protein
MTTADTSINTAAVVLRERRVNCQDPTITENEEPWQRHDTLTTTTVKDFDLDCDQLNQEDEENKYEVLYEFPASTFTFLISEKVFSFSFAVEIIVHTLCMTCLLLALRNQMSVGQHVNELGLAAEVSKEVHATRYIAILVAIINETEIPQALELIGMGFEQKASNKDRISFKRIFFSSLMRLMIGYTFLCSVFVVVVQVTDVLSMFMNILALSFIESIDDIVYELAKRGFIGRAIMDACEPVSMLVDEKTSNGELTPTAIWSNRVVRFFFTINLVFG